MLASIRSSLLFANFIATFSSLLLVCLLVGCLLILTHLLFSSSSTFPCASCRGFLGVEGFCGLSFGL